MEEGAVQLVAALLPSVRNDGVVEGGGVGKMADPAPHLLQGHQAALAHRLLVVQGVDILPVDAELPRHQQPRLDARMTPHLLEDRGAVHQRDVDARTEQDVDVLAFPLARQRAGSHLAARQHRRLVMRLEVEHEPQFRRAEQVRREPVDVGVKLVDQGARSGRTPRLNPQVLKLGEGGSIGGGDAAGVLDLNDPLQEVSLIGWEDHCGCAPSRPVLPWASVPPDPAPGAALSLSQRRGPPNPLRTSILALTPRRGEGRRHRRVLSDDAG